MILQVVTDPVKDTLDMSRAISEYGILIVLSALMIISFIAMAIILFKMMRNTNDKIIESQNRVEKQNEQIMQQNKTIESLLNKIADTETTESLLEQTKWNAEKLLMASCDKSMLELITGTSEILMHNNIDNKEFTDNRIHSLVRTVDHNQTKWLNNFKYQGTRLGDLAMDEMGVKKVIEAIMSFIYSTDHSRDLLVRNLSLIYTDFKNQIKL